MTKHEIREVFINAIAEQYDLHNELIPEWLHIGDIEFEVEEQEPFKPTVEIDLYSVIKQKYIEREVLDKIRAEIESHCGLAKEENCKFCSYCNSLMGVREILEILDKYKAERNEDDE